MEAAIRRRLVVEDQDGSNGEGGGTRDPLSVTELVLDGSKIKIIDSAAAAYLGSFANLETLCMNQTGLSSIADFPHLPKLKILEAQDNHLGSQSNLESLPEKLPAIEELSLAGNRFKSCAEIDFLKKFASLKVLDLDLNPLAKSSAYRSEIFAMCPSVEVVDDLDRSGKDVADDGEESDEENEDADGPADDGSDCGLTLKEFYEADVNELSDDDHDGDFDPQGADDGDDVDEESSGASDDAMPDSAEVTPSKRVRTE